MADSNVVIRVSLEKAYINIFKILPKATHDVLTLMNEPYKAEHYDTYDEGNHPYVSAAASLIIFGTDVSASRLTPQASATSNSVNVACDFGVVNLDLVSQTTFYPMFALEENPRVDLRIDIPFSVATPTKERREGKDDEGGDGEGDKGKEGDSKGSNIKFYASTTISLIDKLKAFHLYKVKTMSSRKDKYSQDYSETLDLSGFFPTKNQTIQKLGSVSFKIEIIQNTPPDPSSPAITTLPGLLSPESPYSETVANHIWSIYKNPMTRLDKAGRDKLFGLVRGSIDPEAFDSISHLLCLKSANPIKTACYFISLINSKIEELASMEKFFLTRRWEGVLEKCEQRTVNLLDTASATPISNRYEHVEMEQLLTDIPEAVLDCESLKVAAHQQVEEIITKRWQTKHTNLFCGMVCPCGSSHRASLIERLGLFNTAKASFWWNFLFYLTYVLLCTINLAQQDSVSYLYNTRILDQLINDEQYPFLEISDIQSYYNYVDNVLGKKLFELDDMVLWSNYTFRQWRVKGTACYYDKQETCYQNLHDDFTNWETGARQNGGEWDTTLATSLYSLQVMSIPVGGYKVTTSMTPEALSNLIQQFNQTDWIDNQTRVIIAEIALFNENEGLFAILAQNLEITSVGAYLPSYTTFVISSHYLVVEIDPILIALIIITVGYLTAEMYEVSTFLCCSKEKERKSASEILAEYFKDVWNFADAILFILLLTVQLLRLVPPFSFPDSETSISTLQFLWVVNFCQSLIEGLLVMILWWRFSYFFRVSEFAGPLFIVTIKMFKDMVFFIFFAFIMISGFGVFMNVILRDDFSAYQSTVTTFVTVAFSALGMADQITSESGTNGLRTIAGNVTLVCYLLVITILLINLLIALMGKTYEKVNENARGSWVMQYVVLLVNYEKLTVPAPLNIIAYFVYLIMNCCCLQQLTTSEITSDLELLDDAYHGGCCGPQHVFTPTRDSYWKFTVSRPYEEFSVTPSTVLIDEGESHKISSKKLGIICPITITNRLPFDVDLFLVGQVKTEVKDIYHTTINSLSEYTLNFSLEGQVFVARVNDGFSLDEKVFLKVGGEVIRSSISHVHRPDLHHSLIKDPIVTYTVHKQDKHFTADQLQKAPEHMCCPEFHVHPLPFYTLSPDVSLICDLCASRVVQFSYRCEECDFDMCLKCVWDIGMRSKQRKALSSKDDSSKFLWFGEQKKLKYKQSSVAKLLIKKYFEKHLEETVEEIETEAFYDDPFVSDEEQGSEYEEEFSDPVEEEEYAGYSVGSGRDEDKETKDDDSTAYIALDQ